MALTFINIPVSILLCSLSNYILLGNHTQVPTKYAVLDPWTQKTLAECYWYDILHFFLLSLLWKLPLHSQFLLLCHLCTSKASPTPLQLGAPKALAGLESLGLVTSMEISLSTWNSDTKKRTMSMEVHPSAPAGPLLWKTLTHGIPWAWQ